MEFSKVRGKGLQCPHTLSPFLQLNHLYWHLLTGTADFHLNGKLAYCLILPTCRFTFRNEKLCDSNWTLNRCYVKIRNLKRPCAK